MQPREPANTKENDVNVCVGPQAVALGKQQRGPVSEAAAEARPDNPRRVGLAPRKDHAAAGPSAPAAVPMFIRGARLAVAPPVEARAPLSFQEQVELDPLRPPPQPWGNPWGNSSSGSARLATAAAGSSVPAAAPALHTPGFLEEQVERMRQLAVEKQLRAAFSAAAMSNAAAAEKAAVEKAAAETAAAGISALVAEKAAAEEEVAEDAPAPPKPAAEASAASSPAAALAAAKATGRRKGRGEEEPEPTGTPLERCALILSALLKRKDAYWFADPVPKDTEDYFTTISSPTDYGSIQSKLEAAGYPDADAFASDVWLVASNAIHLLLLLLLLLTLGPYSPNPNQVRLVASNAVTYSPEADNSCNKAARAHLNEFEKQFLKQGLATDDGAAAAQAAEAAKPKRAKRS